MPKRYVLWTRRLCSTETLSSWEFFVGQSIFWKIQRYAGRTRKDIHSLPMKRENIKTWPRPRSLSGYKGDGMKRQRNGKHARKYYPGKWREHVEKWWKMQMTGNEGAVQGNMRQRSYHSKRVENSWFDRDWLLTSEQKAAKNWAKVPKCYESLQRLQRYLCFSTIIISLTNCHCQLRDRRNV